MALVAQGRAPGVPPDDARGGVAGGHGRRARLLVAVLSRARGARACSGGAHFIKEAGTIHAERGFRPEKDRRRAEHPPAAEEPRAPPPRRLRYPRALSLLSACCFLSVLCGLCVPSAASAWKSNAPT